MTLATGLTAYLIIGAALAVWHEAQFIPTRRALRGQGFGRWLAVGTYVAMALAIPLWPLWIALRLSAFKAKALGYAYRKLYGEPEGGH
jgi:type VI protein secretion system component VasK